MHFFSHDKKRTLLLFLLSCHRGSRRTQHYTRRCLVLLRSKITHDVRRLGAPGSSICSLFRAVVGFSCLHSDKRNQTLQRTMHTRLPSMLGCIPEKQSSLQPQRLVRWRWVKSTRRSTPLHTDPTPPFATRFVIHPRALTDSSRSRVFGRACGRASPT